MDNMVGWVVDASYVEGVGLDNEWARFEGIVDTVDDEAFDMALQVGR